MLSLFGGVSHYLSRAPKYRFMISTIRLAENNDTEARDNILQIGHLLDRNGVRWEFQCKSSKMSRWFLSKVRQAEDGPNVITDRTFITLGFKMLLRMGLLLRLGPNVITDGTFITPALGSKCYYRWDLYYTWVQLLHLCLLQTRLSRSLEQFSYMIYFIYIILPHSSLSREHEQIIDQLPT